MELSLRNLRTVVAMIAGGTGIVVIVLGFVFPGSEGEGPPLLTYVAVGWGLLAALARFPILRQVERSGRRRIASGSYGASGASRQSHLIDEHGDDGRLFLLYQTRSMIGAALFDGAALLGGVATYLDGNLVGACLGLALCVALLFTMPGHDRFEQWKEEQRKLLRESA